MGDNRKLPPYKAPSTRIIGGKFIGNGSATLLRNSGGSVGLIGTEAENFGTAVEVDGGGFTHFQGAKITNSQKAAARISDSTFLFDNSIASGGEYGLDLGRGARGAIRNSELIDNWEADIRYRRDVSVRVFNTVARDLLNRVNGWGIEEIDTRWMSNRLLTTTSGIGKARWLLRLSKKGALGLIGGELASEALKRALDML